MTEEELFREALVHMPESVSIYGLDGTVLYLNPPTERIMGITLAELRGKRLFELYPDAVGSAFHTAFMRVAAGGPPQDFEHYYPRFDGWFSNHVVRIGDRIHVYARDVTEDARNRRRIQTLARISQIVTADDQAMPTTANAVAQIVTDVLDADCTVALLSPDQRWLEVVARTSREPTTLELTNQLMRWPADTGTPSDALRTRSAVLVHLEHTEESTLVPEVRTVVGKYEPSSVLVVPLIVGDAAIGVLIVSRRRGAAPLTQHDRTLATEIAPSIALYIGLARRRAEGASARQRLAVIADAIPALVAFVGKDERYQYANATYLQWIRIAPEEIIGKRPSDLFPGYAVIEPHVRNALAGNYVRFRTRMAYPSGTRDVDAQYVPVRDPNGDIEGFAVLIQDVSAEVRIADLERERLDAERRLTARLQSFVAISGRLAGATTTDEIGRVLVDEGVRALHAAMGGMWTVSPDGGELVLVRQVGFLPEHDAAFQRVPLRPGGPLHECVATGKGVFISSRTEYAARYPHFEQAHRPQAAPPIAFAALPLTIEGRVYGCINIAFHDERRLTPDERTYLELLSSHGAEALRRALIDAELRDVSETQAAVIQASPAAISLIDQEGIVQIWNPAAAEMLAAPASDVIGRPHPFSRDPGWWNDMRTVLAGNVIHGRQVRRQRMDGSHVDVELYAAPVRMSDGRSMVLSIAVDITERQRVERGRHLIANATAIFGKSLELEQTLREIVAVPLVGGLADWCCVDILTDDNQLERIAQSLDESSPMPTRLAHDPRHSGASAAIAERRPFIIPEITEDIIRQLARDERHLQALRSLKGRSSLSVPLFVGERVVGALSVLSRTRVFDELDIAITNEIASHAATAIENARLFDEARQARQEAEDANRAKDEFMAMLGHELRNPLAPMMTAVELMSMRGAHHLERERAVIARQVHHLSRLVDDLLDVSRITRGKVELHRERVPLATVVAKAIEQTSPLLEQRKHRLVVDVSRDLIVYADPVRLAQVISNLVSNAAKYTPEGGLVEVHAHRRAPQIILVVRDTGIGIEPAMLPRVFELFVQAPQSNARPAGGLGLGLTIVKSLVELHGGSVSARSDGIGKGTELTVQLPAAEATTLPAIPTLSPIPRTHASRRILVVDDNEDAAILLAAVLEAHGHEMRTAFDAPSALKIADEFRPEIAVVDIGLPVMDGYELAERLRTSPELGDVRLIAVSGYGQESDRARARAAGFQAHLAKPVPIETLVKLVDEAM